jgi:ATP-binding cassette, subfamily B, bacterial PglK
VIEMPRLVIETSLIGFILILFAVSVAVGTATGELLSTLGLFAYAGLRMQPSLQKLVSGLNSVRYSGAAVADVYDDLLLVEQLDTHEPAGSELSFEQELRLDAVTFTYEGMDRPAVLDADLTIRPGEVIGVCGPRVAARRRSPT